jgi:hypothetical protein
VRRSLSSPFSGPGVRHIERSNPAECCHRQRDFAPLSQEWQTRVGCLVGRRRQVQQHGRRDDRHLEDRQLPRNRSLRAAPAHSPLRSIHSQRAHAHQRSWRRHGRHRVSISGLRELLRGAALEQRKLSACVERASAPRPSSLRRTCISSARSGTWWRSNRTRAAIRSASMASLCSRTCCSPNSRWDRSDSSRHAVVGQFRQDAGDDTVRRSTVQA